MHLPIAGLMTDVSGEEIAAANEKVREAIYALGVPADIEPFMNMAFVSLPVIPPIKMTPQGLVDVDRQETPFGCLLFFFEGIIHLCRQSFKRKMPYVNASGNNRDTASDCRRWPYQ